MPIEGDLQSLNPGAKIDLYQIDVSSIDPGTTQPFCFTPMVALEQATVRFRGLEYVPLPIETTGFLITVRGSLPRPRIIASNVGRLMTTLLRQYNKLVGARVTRIRTFTKYLDGEELADPMQTATEELWIIDRPAKELPDRVEFELSSALDLEGQRIPRRVISGACGWVYQGKELGIGPGECSYSKGSAGDQSNMYTEEDQLTLDPLQDRCGKRLKSCKLRYGATAVLPFGGFPSTVRQLR